MPIRDRSRTRTARPGWFVIAVAAVAVACTGGDDDAAPTSTIASTTTTTPVRPDDGVLSIGMFLPTTGSGAPLGEPMIQAVESAIDEINEAGGVLGQPVTRVLLDESADTGFEALLSAGVDAVIGPASSLIALSQLDDTIAPGSEVITCSPSATALALDDYPDDGLFFRTVPSDSLQMAAIAKRAASTGVSSVAIGFLDDPYGRGLADALVEEVEGRREVVAEVGFGGDEDDLSSQAQELLAGDPGLIVVLGDADDGSRLLTALDAATDGGANSPEVIVNDAIRTARQTMQGLSPGFRNKITAVAPLARSVSDEGPEGFFAAHARDCVNLIALATVRAGTDAPSRIKAFMSSVSRDGRPCSSFADCAGRLSQNLQIDYSGASGSVDLSIASGDPVRAWFEAFGFADDGRELTETAQQFEVP